MKSQDISLGKHLNDKIWEHGMQNPPHHVKVKVTKDDKGKVNADMFDAPAEATVVDKKVEEKKAVEEKKVVEEKKETKPQKKPVANPSAKSKSGKKLDSLVGNN